jgi:hypothetical protein
VFPAHRSFSSRAAQWLRAYWASFRLPSLPVPASCVARLPAANHRRAKASCQLVKSKTEAWGNAESTIEDRSARRVPSAAFWETTDGDLGRNLQVYVGRLIRKSAARSDDGNSRVERLRFEVSRNPQVNSAFSTLAWSSTS